MKARPAIGQRVRVADVRNPYAGRKGTVASHSDSWPSIVYVNLDPVMNLGQQLKPAEKLKGIAWDHMEAAS